MASGSYLWPMNLAVNKSNGDVFVTGGGDSGHFVYSFSSTSCTGTGSVDTVGLWPTDIEISQDGTRLFCTNYYSSNISIVDLTTNTLLDTVDVMTKPWGITVSPDGKNIYVGIEGGYQSGQTVQVVHTDDFSNYLLVDSITDIGTGLWDLEYID